MESLQDKQTLLRQEVLQGGLNAEEFIDYLGELKKEGDNVDLENWSISDLRKAISSFKARRETMRFDVMNSRMSMNIKKSKIFQAISSVVPKQRVLYEHTQLWDYQMRETIDCCKSDIRMKIPENNQPKVTIQKFETKSVGGFIFGIGARNQLHLTISTNFTQNKVERKSEDADWLRNVLMVDYPGYYMPYLSIDRQLNQDDKKGISARISDIESFLNKILRCQAFHSSKHVQVFFQQYNHKRFIDFRNRQALLDIVRDSDILETSTGTIFVQLSDKLNKTMKSASTIGAQFNNLYNQMMNCSSRIIGYMQKLKKQVGFLYNISNRLGQKYSQAQQLFKTQDMKLPTIYLSFSNISSNIFRNLERHMKAFNDLSEGFTKNVSKDWAEFVNHDGKVQKEHKKYIYEKDILMRKKQRYINQLSKWQLPQAQYLQMKGRDLSSLTKQQKFAKMFPSDNDNQNRHRLWLACLNQNYITSYKTFLKQQQRLLLQKYLPYSGEATCVSTDIITNLKQFNSMIFG